MPVLKYLADTNVISDFMRQEPTVAQWLLAHPNEVAISTITLAEMRRGIELKRNSKAGLALNRQYKFILQDYAGGLSVFDEAAAAEWGRIMAEAHTRNRPVPYHDSLIGAVARSLGIKVLTRNPKDFPFCECFDPATAEEHPAWPGLA